MTTTTASIPIRCCYYEIPADGEYVVEIKDAIYRGREDFVYRITVGELPFVTSIFPLGGRAGAQTTVELKGWNLPATTLTMDAKDKAPGVYPLSVRKGELRFQPRAVRGRHAAGMPRKGAERRAEQRPAGHAADHRQRAHRPAGRLGRVPLRGPGRRRRSSRKSTPAGSIRRWIPCSS